MAADNKVRIILEVDTQTGEAKLAQAGKHVEELGKKAQGAGAAAREGGAGVAAFTQALSGMGGPVGAAAGGLSRFVGMLTGPGGLLLALGAVTTGLVAFGNRLVEQQERLRNLSVQTGFAISTLEAFGVAAREAGEDPESLARSFQHLTMAMAAILKGTPEVAKEFERIGVPIRELVRRGASPEEVFDATAKAIVRIQDPLAKSAAMADLLGARSRAMGTVIEEVGHKSVRGYTEELERAGLITSRVAQAMAEQLDATADRTSRIFGMMTKKIQEWTLEGVLANVDAIQKLLRVLGLFKGKTALEEMLDRIREQTEKAAALPTGERKLGVEVQAKALEQLNTMLVESSVNLDAINRIAFEVRKSVSQFNEVLDRPTLEQWIERLTKARMKLFETELASKNLRAETEKDLQAISALSDAMTATVHPLELLVQQEFEAEKRLRLFEEATRSGGQTLIEFTGQSVTLREVIDDLTLPNKGLDAFKIRLRELTPDEEEIDRLRRWAEAFEAAFGEERRLTARFQPGDVAQAQAQAPELSDASRAVVAALDDLVRGLTQGTLDIDQALDRFAQGVIGQQITRGFEGLFKAMESGTLSLDQLTDSSSDLRKATQAAATALGAIAGAAVGGGGESARTGGTTGAVAGGVIGGIFGFGEVGAILGGLIGGAIGGALDDELAEIREKVQRQLGDATSAAIREGLLEGVRSGDTERAWTDVKLALREAVLTGLVDAFAQHAVFRTVLQPLFDIFAEALGAGLGPEQILAKIGPALAESKERIVALRPVFGAFLDLARDIDQAMSGTVESVAALNVLTRIGNDREAEIVELLGAQGARMADLRVILGDNVIALGEFQFILGETLEPTGAFIAMLEQVLVILGFSADEAHRLVEEMVAAGKVELPSLPVPGGPEGFDFGAEREAEAAAREAEQAEQERRRNLQQAEDAILDVLDRMRDLTDTSERLEAELAFLDVAMRRAEQSIAAAGDAGESFEAIQRLMQLSQRRYELERDLVNALAQRVETLGQAVTDTVGQLADLTLQLAAGPVGLPAIISILADLASLFGDVGMRATTAAVALRTLTGGLARFGPAFLFAPGAGAAIGGAVAQMQATAGAILASGLPVEVQMTHLLALAQEWVNLVNQAREAIRQHYETQREQLRQTAETEKAALRTAADLRLKVLQAEREALETRLDAERKALETALDLAREWGRTLESVREQMTDILLGPFGRTRPAAQLAAALELFETARAGFALGPTPQAAEALQGAAGDLLSVAAEVWPITAAEFEHIKEVVLESLRQVERFAQAQPTEVQLLAQIEAHEADATEALAKIDAQMEATRSQLTSDLKAIDARLAADLTRIDETERAGMVVIEAAIAAQTAVLAGPVFKALDALWKTQQEATQALNTLTGGLPVEAFTALKAQEQVDWLTTIHADLVRIYGALGGVPSFQVGGTLPWTGLFRGHEGERVTPRGESGVTLVFGRGSVVVQGGADMGAQFGTQVERWAKSARGRVAIQGIAAGRG